LHPALAGTTNIQWWQTSKLNLAHVVSQVDVCAMVEDDRSDQTEAVPIALCQSNACGMHWPHYNHPTTATTR
jgi:hypothetical protein